MCLGKVFTVGAISFGTFTILPITDCCPPHHNCLKCINGILDATKCSSNGYNSNSGGLGGNPSLFYVDNFGGFNLDILILHELQIHSILLTDVHPT